MEDDIGIALVAAQLEQRKIFVGETNGRQFNRHALAALRTAHLLADALNDLMEGVGVKLHM
jgi:hypothetical protein